MSDLLSTTLSVLGLLGPSESDPLLAAGEEAIRAVNYGEEGALERLERVYELLVELHNDLIDDEEAIAMRKRVQLNLTRAYMNAEMDGAAVQMADEIVRCGAHIGVDIQYEYGPSLAELLLARGDALRAASGVASIEVTCDVPCDVFMCEEPTVQNLPVLVGENRVAVRDRKNAVPPYSEVVVVNHRDQRVNIEYPSLGEMGSLDPKVIDYDKSDFPPPRGMPILRQQPLLPLWAEVSGLTLGIALAGISGVLFYFHGRCPGGFDPAADSGSCPRLYNNVPYGATLASVGGGVALGFGTVLVVDRARGRKKKVSLVGAIRPLWGGRF